MSTLTALLVSVLLSLLKRLIGEEVVARVFIVTAEHVAVLTKNTWDDEIVQSFAKAWGINPADLKAIPELNP